MASMFYCDVCDKRDKTSIAKNFCSDCEDKLCSECLSVHCALKSCLNHHVVDVTVTADTSFAVNKFCEKHADLTLEVYCCDHDVICCRSCMTDDHRSCGKLTPIEVASKDIKSSNMFEEISKQANNLKEASHLMTDTVKKSKQLLNESKVASIEKISKLKEELQRRIDELASRSITEINILYSELSENVNINEKEVKKRVHIIQETLERFDSVAKNGSDKQIFLLLNSIKTDISKIETDLQNCFPTLKTATVEFEESDVITMLPRLGSIKNKAIPCDIQYTPIKQQQAQLSKTLHPAPTSFQLEQKLTFTYEKIVSITGMCVTKDNRIILCNWRSGIKELLVLTDQGKFIQSIQLEDRPFNIAIGTSRTDAWVTLPEASYLQIIDTTTLSLKHQVKVSKGCYAIDFVGSNIALGRIGQVDIISQQGICIKSFKVGSTNTFSLCYSGTDQLYCCEADYNTLHCVTQDGKDVFSYRSDDLHGPICVSTDHQGNVYVLCYSSNNLHKLTADGKLIDVMLHTKDGLYRPHAATFNRSCSKLFITNLSENAFFTFDCK